MEELPTGDGLTVEDVTVTFGGITALDSVSAEVAPNEVVGVIGPNGAGKTTLFNVICGFVKPDRGVLRWRGATLGGHRPDRLTGLGIARTLQGVGLFQRLTVRENVMVGAERFRRARIPGAMLGLPGSDRDERALRGRADAMLERLECGDIGDRLPTTLPFAVQKRVALARALVCEPALLMLDEPAGGLGAEELEGLGKLIRELRSSMSVMLVEHHMDLVMSICDRVIVLDFGRVIAAGDPESVKRDPQVLEAYLGREADEQSPALQAGIGDADD
jgi:branched-chain amino acid transport system ATP-binding protein